MTTKASSSAPSNGRSQQGIETATFHILTPYPGTRSARPDGGRRAHHLRRLGPVRHAPRRLPPGPDDAPKRWRPATGGPIAISTAGARSSQGAWTKPTCPGRLRHLAYAGGWKKFEPLWDLVIRLKRVSDFLPLLETVLAGKQSPNRNSLDSEGVFTRNSLE